MHWSHSVQAYPCSFMLGPHNISKNVLSPWYQHAQYTHGRLLLEVTFSVPQHICFFFKTDVKQHLFVAVVCRGVQKTGVYSTTELSIWSPPAHHGQWAQCSPGSCWEVVSGGVSLSPSELLNIVAASRRRGRWVNATFKNTEWNDAKSVNCCYRVWL